MSVVSCWPSYWFPKERRWQRSACTSCESVCYWFRRVRHILWANSFCAHILQSAAWSVAALLLLLLVTHHRKRRGKYAGENAERLDPGLYEDPPDGLQLCTLGITICWCFSWKLSFHRPSLYFTQAFGCAVLATGIWIKLEAHKYLDIDPANPVTSHVAIFFMSIGVAIALVGLLSCYCTLSGNPILLYLVYSFLTFVLLATVMW